MILKKENLLLQLININYLNKWEGSHSFILYNLFKKLINYIFLINYIINYLLIILNNTYIGQCNK